MSNNRFGTNVPRYETEDGDTILYPFSPPIFQSEIDNRLSKELVEEGRKLTIKDDDYAFKLAGNLKYGRSYHYKDEYVLKVEPYLKSYVERFFNGLHSQWEGDGNPPKINELMLVQQNRKKQRQGTLRLQSLWINFSKKHDYKPNHTHTGVLSFVIFCKVPEKIFEVQADSNTQNAGKLIFSHGEPTNKLMGSEYTVKPYEDLIFIFPAELRHQVPPIWVDEERISVSGNFVVI